MKNFYFKIDLFIDFTLINYQLNQFIKTNKIKTQLIDQFLKSFQLIFQTTNQILSKYLQTQKPFNIRNINNIIFNNNINQSIHPFNLILLQKVKEEERKRRKLEKLKQEKIIEEEIQRQQEELLKLKQKKLQEIKGIYEESDNSDIDQKKRGKDQEEDLIPKRDLSNDGKKSSSKTNNSITKIQKPSQQLPIKTQTTASTTGQNVVNKAIKNRYAEQEDEEQYDEDDVINNIDFNDSSSKQEDSSNEKVYAPVNVQTQQQNRILPDLLVDDDFELLQQGEQTNYRDGDTVKKKEIVGVKKSTIKTSSGLPPSSRSQAQTVTEQIPRFKTTQNQNSLLTSNQTINLTKSVRSNSGLKDRSEIPLTNNVEPSTLRSAASYKSKYTNNLALSTTLAQTRNHLDETKTKFEQYKQKYGNNNKFNQNYSLIDKDD